MKDKIQKPYPESNDDETRHARGHCGSEKRINLIIGELKAIFTCSNDFLSLNRFLTRTMVMLKKERSLLKIWKQAAQYRQDIERERNNLLEALYQLKKELKLDEKLPSLIKQSHQFPPVDLEYSEKTRKWLSPLPKPISLSWIDEAYDWCVSQKSAEFLGDLEAKLYILSMRWMCFEPTWYHVGEHPVKTLTLLLCICDYIECHLQEDDFFFSMGSSRERAKYLLQALRPIVTNLVAELPIIKSWGTFSVKAIEWKAIAKKVALEIWKNDRLMSRPAVARHILSVIKGHNITEETLVNYLALIDPRSSEERRLSQRRRSRKEQINSDCVSF